jgi:hypothetical protein
MLPSRFPLFTLSYSHPPFPLHLPPSSHAPTLALPSALPLALPSALPLALPSTSISPSQSPTQHIHFRVLLGLLELILARPPEPFYQLGVMPIVSKSISGKINE